MAVSSTTTGSAATIVERKAFCSGSYFCNQISMSAVDAESKERNKQDVETQPVTTIKSSKSQVPSSREAPSSNVVFQVLLGAWFRCILDHWCLGILWCLE